MIKNNKLQKGEEKLGVEIVTSTALERLLLAKVTIISNIKVIKT